MMNEKFQLKSLRFWFGLVLIPLMALSLSGSPSFAKKKSKKDQTVGQLLKKIDKKAARVKIKKGKSSLPKFKKIKRARAVNLYSVKPPSSKKLYYDEGTNEAELEAATDESIKQLFKLTQRFRTSSRRGELWLRLAELYVEKARLIEHQIQQKYDDQLVKYQAKETKRKPRLDLRPARSYNKKAVQLYEWFLRDFPKDSKVDQALFFLGYNYFELGQEAKGKSFYERLTKNHPKSSFVDEANFSLGEYHFEREKWKEALTSYMKVAKNRRARLYSFALYKAAWCQYKLGSTKLALKYLVRVIRAGQTRSGRSNSGVSKIKLANEAMKDLVVFYADSGSAERARSYFEKIAGEKSALKMLDKLAFHYAGTGNSKSAAYVFKELISEQPNSKKAFDYQYQIVSLYPSAGTNKTFRLELFSWIENYGPGSVWYESNKKDKEFTAKSEGLIETTLRNYILQQHQTAQNSRAPYSQKMAKAGYELYFQTFKKASRLDEMHFFYGELLYDMKQYEKAAFHYLWVSDNKADSKYYEKSLLNAILALENRMPDAKEIKKIVGDSTEPVEFDRTVKAFEKVGLRYVEKYPKAKDSSAIKYKVASLYYYYNQFDKALNLFEKVIDENPKTKYAEYSANLILDIYNIRKDYEGLEKAGQRMLKVPAISRGAVGNQIRSILAKTSFKKAQNLEVSKDYLKSAVSYEKFARKNGSSDLAVSAWFNAGVNYERAGDLGKAIQMYGVVVRSKNKKGAQLRGKTEKFLAGLYQKTGQYSRAADAFENYAKANPKDKESANFWFNAAAIRDGMNSFGLALRNYEKYLSVSKDRTRFDSLFLIGKMQERRNRLSSAIKYYEKYISGPSSSPARVVEACFRVALINERLRRKTQAERYFKKTIAVQRRLSKKSPVGASFAAESKFKMVYKTYEEFRRIRIPRNAAKQGAAVEKKLGLLNRLKEQLKPVIRYDHGPMVVASLALIGQAYQHLSASIYNAPIPKGLDADGRKQYIAGVDSIARPFKEEAIKSYSSALEKANTLQGYNSWTKVAATELNGLDPEKYPGGSEEVFLTKVPDWREI